MLDSLSAKLAAMGAGIGAFYRANKWWVLGGITLLSILLIVWARMGFSFETSRFYAAECGNGVCEALERRVESDRYCPEDCEAAPPTSGCTLTGTTCNGNKIFNHYSNCNGADGQDCAASGKICQNNNGSTTVDGARCVDAGGAQPPAGGSHLECRNNACVSVAGAGSNTGGCTTAGAACGQQGGYGSCQANIQHTTGTCRLGCAANERPASANPNQLGCTNGATCCVSKPAAMSAAVWASDYDTSGTFFVAPALYSPQCNSRNQQFPYMTARPKKGGGTFSFPEHCVEKPDNCPEGYHAEGADPGTVCAPNTTSGGGTPPSGGTPPPSGGTLPQPATLSVVCGTTQNVLTWATPLPAGSNASAINKTTIPASGAQTAVQIGIDLGTNPSSYTDTNVVAGNRYTYAFKNHVSVRSNEVSCPSGATTTDPNDPGPGKLAVACSGGSSPSITVRWSKSPPPGSTGELNAGNPAVLNRTVGTNASEQINPSATDKGTYWEWVDNASPAVTSGTTVVYRGKYGPNVSTNSVSFAATPTACGQAAVLACAPVSQNVAVNQAAALQSSGAGSDPVQWSVDGQTKSGEAVTFAFATPGTKAVTVTAGSRTATCTIVVGTATSEALAMIFTGRNVSTGGVSGTSVNASPNQEVEFSAAIRNNTTGNITNVTVQAGMPTSIAYVAGSTTVAGQPTSMDSVAAGGLAIGSLGAGQEVTVRWRGRLSATAFPVGQSQAAVNATVTAEGQSARSGQVTVLVTRGTGAGTASTGPGEAVLAALLVSAVVTLLYVSYTHGPAYRRREVEGLGKERDPMDFRT